MDGKRRNEDTMVEIDLKKIWASFVAQWKLILIIGISCALLALVYSSIIATPKYTTETIIMILNSDKTQGQIDNNDLALSSNLSTDFVNIATSRTSIEEVERRSGAKDVELKAAVIPNTRQIKITVTHTDPEKARQIADCAADVASERISEIMDIPDIVRIVDKAFVPDSQSYPSVIKFTAVGFLAGFIITWLIVLIFFLSNDKINVTEDVEKYLDVPLLAVIPIYETRDVVNSKRGKKRKKKATRRDANEEITRRNIKTTATINKKKSDRKER